VLTGLILVAVVCGVARFADAQDKERHDRLGDVAAAEIERVLIPVDAERKPVGTKYYLSEQFLRELLNASNAPSEAEGQWLLFDAAYTGELTEGREKGSVVAGNFALTFTLETLARDTSIKLPLVRDEAAWQPTAMLDGVPLPLEWRDGKSGCEVEIEQPGRYSLTIYGTPKTRPGERSQFRLTVPPLPVTTYELRATATVSDIRVNGVVTGSDADRRNTAGILKGELAADGYLAVDWAELQQSAGAAPAGSVSVMSWLHVGPGPTILENKYIVEGGRAPESLSVSYDDRWQLDSAPETKDGERSNSAGRRTLQVSLTGSGDERREATVRWKLKVPPTAGHFSLPPVELVALTPAKRWLAVSSDPTTECTVIDSSATTTTAKEFFANWGDTAADDSPAFVLTNLDAKQAGTLALRPHETETVTQDVLHVAIGREALRVVYQANVTPGSQHRFQYPLTVPERLVVDEVTLSANGKRVPLRWTRDAENHVQVFFGEGLSAEYVVSLSGRIAVERGQPVRLPRVASTSSPAAQQVQLYRDDEVAVDVRGLPPAEEMRSGPTSLSPVEWLVRPIGTFHLDASASNNADVTIQANQPRFAGNELTTLARDSRGWSAAYRCQFVVEAGDVDIVRVNAPANWAGPFEVEAGVPVTTEVVPRDGGRQTIAIRLATPVKRGGPLNLLVRSPLSISAGAPAVVPDITIGASEGVRSYVVVPKSLDSQPVVWNEAGVEEAEMPKGLLVTAAEPAQWRQLAVSSRPFQVSLNVQPASQPAPRIRLVDTAIFTGERGSELIVSRQIIVSDGVADCTLRLPADQELVSVAIDGRPALKSEIDAAHWRVALGAARLPQAIEIITRTKAEAAGPQTLALSRPALFVGEKAIPVDLSLWSFASPGDAAGCQIEGAKRVNAKEQAALRVERLARIADAGAGAASDTLEADSHNWLGPWVVLLERVRGETQQFLASPAADQVTAQVGQSTDEQLGQATAQLDDWLADANVRLVEVASSDASRAAGFANQVMFSSTALTAGANANYFVAEGGEDRLPIQFTAVAPTVAETKLLAVAVIAIGATVLVWLSGSRPVLDFLCRWPHVLGVLLGVMWWAWLWPSLFGLVIVAISVWHALRFDWPGRSIRAEASTVLRSTRSH
jgi:hypothetical protein